MRSESKDSEPIVRFMTLFEQLKDWCDDIPEELEAFSASDDSMKELCAKVALEAYIIETGERKSQKLFAAPVDPKFLAAWRDYEKRYEEVVLRSWFSDFVSEQNSGEPNRISKSQVEWNYADEKANEHAAAIEEAIRFSQFNAEQDDRWDSSQEDYVQKVKEGITAWRGLRRDTGFDLHGVFRRRALVPFVLIPRHVAAKYGSTRTLSMLTNLQQAHDAFIYGATHGALALMRSVMEAVLRDHYNAEGQDLKERINDVRNCLPKDANAVRLHTLWKLANRILHLDQEEEADFYADDQVKLEKEIISLLFALRALIEGAKKLR